MAAVTEIMIQEDFTKMSTQLLSLYTMYKYLATKSELTVSYLDNEMFVVMTKE